MDFSVLEDMDNDGFFYYMQDLKLTPIYKSKATMFLTEKGFILAFKFFKRKFTNWRQST